MTATDMTRKSDHTDEGTEHEPGFSERLLSSYLSNHVKKFFTVAIYGTPPS